MRMLETILIKFSYYVMKSADSYNRAEALTEAFWR